MTIYEQVKDHLRGKEGLIISSTDVIHELNLKHGTNPTSIILSDFCYNRYNNGIAFNKHIFLYINRNMYKYLGENYQYSGLIYHKPLGQKDEIVVGEWINGIKRLYDEPNKDEKLK